MMHQEPKQRLIKLTAEQALPLLARQADVDVPHIFTFERTYWVRRVEWEAFQAGTSISCAESAPKSTGEPK
jgi:hypothetical protein